MPKSVGVDVCVATNDWKRSYGRVVVMGTVSRPQHVWPICTFHCSENGTHRPDPVTDSQGKDNKHSMPSGCESKPRKGITVSDMHQAQRLQRRGRNKQTLRRTRPPALVELDNEGELGPPGTPHLSATQVPVATQNRIQQFTWFSLGSVRVTGTRRRTKNTLP